MKRSETKRLGLSWAILLLVLACLLLDNHKLTWPLTLAPEVHDPIDEATLPSGQKILLIGTSINPKNDYGPVPPDAKRGWTLQGIANDYQRGLTAYIKIPGKKNTAFDKIAYATIGLDDPDSPYDRDDLLFNNVSGSRMRDEARTLLKKNVLRLYFDVYPKSAKSVALRIFNEDREELARFEINNPESVRTQPHDWEPEPVPIRRDVGEATVTLVDTQVQPARHKIYATEIERLYGIDAMSPKIPRIKESFLNKLRADAEMFCESPSNERERWVPIQARFEDIEGNTEEFRIGYSGSGWSLSARATHPIRNHDFHSNSKAWRVRTSWVRTLDASYEPHEKIVFNELDFSRPRALAATDYPLPFGDLQGSLVFITGPSRLILEDGVLVEQATAEAGSYIPRIELENPYARKKRLILEFGAPAVGVWFPHEIDDSQLLSVQLIEHGKPYALEQVTRYHGYDWGVPEGEVLRVYALKKPAYDLNGDPIEFNDATLEIFLQEKVTAEFVGAFPGE